MAPGRRVLRPVDDPDCGAAWREVGGGDRVPAVSDGVADRSHHRRAAAPGAGSGAAGAAPPGHTGVLPDVGHSAAVRQDLRGSRRTGRGHRGDPVQGGGRAVLARRRSGRAPRAQCAHRNRSPGPSADRQAGGGDCRRGWRREEHWAQHGGRAGHLLSSGAVRLPQHERGGAVAVVPRAGTERRAAGDLAPRPGTADFGRPDDGRSHRGVDCTTSVQHGPADALRLDRHAVGRGGALCRHGLLGLTTTPRAGCQDGARGRAPRRAGAGGGPRDEGWPPSVSRRGWWGRSSRAVSCSGCSTAPAPPIRRRSPVSRSCSCRSPSWPRICRHAAPRVWTRWSRSGQSSRRAARSLSTCPAPRCC